MTVRILLDLSRLLHDAGRPTPTGILRVELAYAQHWLEHDPQGIAFAAENLAGRFGLIERRQAQRFIAATCALWQGTQSSRLARWRIWARARWIGGLTLLWRSERLLHRALAGGAAPAVFVVVSHAHLERPAAVERLKRRTGARFVYFVHDVIPWQFPEFDTPGWAARVERRARAAAVLADAILVNSVDTQERFIEMVGPAVRPPRIVVAPLGVRPLPHAPAAAPVAAAPYFVMVATIEPKKNHLFLLSLWRQLRAELGAATPHLILIGKRGWENENVVDLIERSRALAGVVEERANLSDAAVAAILAGARALLQPSFAEGYGLPLAEALSLGVPAICSDIPAFREVGGDVPEFIDSLDGPSWRRAIVDYMAAESPRREAQRTRLKAWAELGRALPRRRCADRGAGRRPCGGSERGGGGQRRPSGGRGAPRMSASPR
jgi:glycosyltransferase involved in cell wall biosynthesis